MTLRSRMLSFSLLALLVGCNTPMFNHPNPLQALRPAPKTGLAIQQGQNQPLFPIEQGYTWDYDVVMSPVMDPYVEYEGQYSLWIEGVKQNGPQTELQLRAIDSYSGRYSFPTLIQSPQQITLQDMTFLGHGSDAVEGLRLDFLRTPFQPGMRWEDENWIGKVKGQEEVVVPAGKFMAWRVEVIGTYDYEYTAVGDYWLVPGKGIVKSNLTIPDWHIETRLRSGGLRH